MIAMFMAALMVMCLPFSVAAQGEMDVPVVAGETGNLAMEHTNLDALPSDELGGLTSQITIFDTVERWVDIAGEHAYFTTDTVETEVQDFTTYMFPAGAAIDPEQLTIGDLFQASLSVPVNGVTSIWNTYDCESLVGVGADAQTPHAMTAQYTADVEFDGKYYGVEASRVLELDSAGPAATQVGTPLNQVMATCDETCPSEVEMNDAFGGVWTDMKFVHGDLNGLDTFIVTGKQDGTNAVIADINRDGVFELADEISTGFQVTSDSGQALALIPGGSYDIYGLY